MALDLPYSQLEVEIRESRLSGVRLTPREEKLLRGIESPELRALIAELARGTKGVQANFDKIRLQFPFTTADLALAAGDGLVLTGNTLKVGQGTGIKVGADSIAVDFSVVGQKYAVDIGDGEAEEIPVEHKLGTRDVVAEVYRNESPWDTVAPEAVERTSAEVVTLKFASPPEADEYRVVVKS